MQLRGQRYQFQFNWILLSVALAITLLCLILAFWQFQRADTKQQRLTLISTMQERGRLSLKQLEDLPVEWDRTGLEISVSGYFLPGMYWLLDNSVLDGQVGYDVIALLNVGDLTKASNVIQLGDSLSDAVTTGDERLLLVNLGWILGPSSRDRLPTIALPSGPQDLDAQIKVSPDDRFTLSKQTEFFSGWPKRIQTVDTAQMQRDSSLNVGAILAYSQTAIEPFQPHYQSVVMGPEKHKAYAIQWILIALAAQIIYFSISLQKITPRIDKKRLSTQEYSSGSVR